MNKIRRITIPATKLLSIARGELEIETKEYSIKRSKKITELGLPEPLIFIDIKL